jgi:hypothetical protein
VTTAARPLTCVLYGFGRINRAVLDLASSRPWLRIAAILTRPGGDVSRRPREIVPGAPDDLVIETDAEAVFRRTRPDVALIATKPRLAEVMPHLRVAAQHSRAVLCTAEELAFVDATDGSLADELRGLALRNGSRIVPVGVNPGFLFDQWPLTASALAWTVDHISVRRIVDVSGFPAASRRHLGIGLTPEDIAKGLEDRSVAGHIGFRQSLRILASSLGARVDLMPTEMRPIFAETSVALEGWAIPAGSSVGMEQRATATRDGRPWIELSLMFHARPSLAGLEPMDALDIMGRNEVHVRLPGGVRPGPATAALLVNTIPAALRAEPGYHRAGSLRPGPPWLSGVPPVPARGP